MIHSIFTKKVHRKGSKILLENKCLKIVNVDNQNLYGNRFIIKIFKLFQYILQTYNKIQNHKIYDIKMQFMQPN